MCTLIVVRSRGVMCTTNRGDITGCNVYDNRGDITGCNVCTNCGEITGCNVYANIVVISRGVMSRGVMCAL